MAISKYPLPCTCGWEGICSAFRELSKLTPTGNFDFQFLPLLPHTHTHTQPWTLVLSLDDTKTSLDKYPKFQNHQNALPPILPQNNLFLTVSVVIQWCFWSGSVREPRQLSTTICNFATQFRRRTRVALSSRHFALQD